MTSSVLDRFVKISGHPTLPPGRCIGCGTTGATDYIDTGLQIQFFGRVYICCSCWISTAMRSCDMVPMFNVQTIKADLDVSKSLLSSAVDRIKELEGALASVESLRATIGSIGTVDYSAPSQPEADSDKPELPEERSGNSEQPELSTNGTEQGSPESSSKRGSSSVRSYDGVDDITGLISSI